MTQEAQLKEMIMQELSPAVDAAVKKWFKKWEDIAKAAEKLKKKSEPKQNPEIVKLVREATKELNYVKYDGKKVKTPKLTPKKK